MKNIFVAIIISMFSISSFAQVHKYKSTNYDIEKPNVEGYVTIKAITFHTIDYTNKIIRFEGSNSKGTIVTIAYPYKSTYKEVDNLVFVINQKGVTEFWISSYTNNLGYDLVDGTRKAYYDLTRLK